MYTQRDSTGGSEDLTILKLTHQGQHRTEAESDIYDCLVDTAGMLSWVYVTVGRPSVCLSVCPAVHHSLAALHSAVAGLLLCASRAGDIDRLLHRRRSAAAAPQLDSKCELCHVYSGRTRN